MHKLLQLLIARYSFGTKIGYIRDKVLGGDLFRHVKEGQHYSDITTSLPFCSTTTNRKWK